MHASHLPLPLKVKDVLTLVISALRTAIKLLLSQASGNWKTASLLVSLLYTAEKVANLASTSPLSLSLGSKRTFKSFDPSTLILVRFPTISVVPQMSSKMDSCTEVRVRVRGRTFKPLRLKFLSKIVRLATKVTCFLLNFFSNSRTNLPWILRTFFQTRKGNCTTRAS